MHIRANEVSINRYEYEKASSFLYTNWRYHFFTFEQVTYHLSKNDQKIVAEIKRRYNYEVKLILSQDITAMKSFYPADLVVTNHF